MLNFHSGHVTLLSRYAISIVVFNVYKSNTPFHDECREHGTRLCCFVLDFQRHGWTALPSRKDLRVHWIGEWVGSRVGLGVIEWLCRYLGRVWNQYTILWVILAVADWNISPLVRDIRLRIDEKL